MSGHDEEYVPDDEQGSYDEVRRLLADARADEPMPVEVAARLDDVLASLVAERTADAAPVSGPASATVSGPVSLAERRARRRRSVMAGVGVAAALVVGGAAVLPQLTSPGGVDFATDAGSGVSQEPPTPSADVLMAAGVRLSGPLVGTDLAPVGEEAPATADRTDPARPPAAQSEEESEESSGRLTQPYALTPDPSVLSPHPSTAPVPGAPRIRTESAAVLADDLLAFLDRRDAAGWGPTAARSTVGCVWPGTGTAYPVTLEERAAQAVVRPAPGRPRIGQVVHLVVCDVNGDPVEVARAAVDGR